MAVCQVGATTSDIVESFLGLALLSSKKLDDSQLISRRAPALCRHAPILTLTSGELGEKSPGHFIAGEHDLLGKNLFPHLSWKESALLIKKDNIQSWLLVVEDLDVPLPLPGIRGIFYDIPPEKTTLRSCDFMEMEGNNPPGLLQGGFRYGQNWRRIPWMGPRPLLNHGAHRYFFTLVGLNTRELQNERSNLPVTREALIAENGLLEGKVVCWGEYVANFERMLPVYYGAVQAENQYINS